MLTVAHFIPWTGGGGTEIAVLRMAIATKTIYRNVVFCLSGADALRNSFEAEDIETRTYAAPEPSVRHLSAYLQASKQVANELKLIGADIAHFAEIKAAYHNVLAAKLAGCRTVCHIRNAYPTLDWREKLALRFIDGSIFVSQDARQRFAVRVPADKARVVYDYIEPLDLGCDPTVRTEFNIPVDYAIIGMVARVNPQKDYFTLAAAAQEVIRRNPKTIFMVVGDYSNVAMNRDHYAEVTDKLKEAGVDGSFVFAGHRSDIPRLVAAMDIFVLCTHREGFPLVILEAMSLGKPVIATAVGGIPEIVKPGVTGYLHDHGDAHQLADRLNTLIEDPEEAKRIAQTGLDHVKRKFSRESFAQDLSSAYSEFMRM